MIILFWGEDTARGLNKLNEFVLALLNKKKDMLKSSLFEIEEENFDEMFFKNLLNSHHLFGEKNLVVLKRIFENKEIAEFMGKKIESIKSSENVFIFWEEHLEKETLKILKNSAAKVLEFKKPKNILDKQEKKGGLTLFNLTDAFAQKNSKNAWLILQKLLMQGVSGEEIFWKIFWQIKTLSAVKPYQNKNSQEVSDELKIHPFVAQKSLAAAKRFETNELQNLSQKLIEIYKNNRFNKIELSFGLEQMILSL